MRAYTSTLYTSQVSHKTYLTCNVLEPKCGGLLFDRHKTPLTRRFVVYYCSAVYSVRRYAELQKWLKQISSLSLNLLEERKKR
jgi:hypothetical protein